MYKAFFHLVHRPFEISPDPSFFYATDQHSEALAGLAYGIKERKGILVLTGEVGTGKTLVARCVEELPGADHFAYAHVFNPRLSSQQFLAYLAEEFRLSPRPTTKGDLFIGLTRLLIENRWRGITTVLVVEEAQHLRPVVLEEIRLLSNLESPQGKLLQILLIGQPELEATLDAPDLRQLKQRIPLWFRLRSLSSEETAQYVEHRLKLAGKNGGEIFVPEAVERVYSYAQGIPRLINTLCDNAMMSAFALGQQRVTPDLIEEVASDLKLKRVESTAQAAAPRAPLPASEACKEATVELCSDLDSKRPDESELVVTPPALLPTTEVREETLVEAASDLNLEQTDRSEEVVALPVPLPASGGPKEIVVKVASDLNLEQTDRSEEVLAPPAPLPASGGPEEIVGEVAADLNLEQTDKCGEVVASPVYLPASEVPEEIAVEVAPDLTLPRANGGEHVAAPQETLPAIETCEESTVRSVKVVRVMPRDRNSYPEGYFRLREEAL